MNLNDDASVPAIDEPGVTVYLGDALRLLAQIPSGSIDAVVCDPPYAIRATGLALPDQARPDPDAEDQRRNATNNRSAEIDAFADAAMLGQQSANWHEKETHSRGYADNDNAVFARWVLLWAEECLRVLKPGGHLVAFGGTRTWHRLASSVEDAGFDIRDSLAWLYSTGYPKHLNVGRAVAHHRERSGAGTDLGAARHQPGATLNETEDWNGWYTGVKPAHEPIVLARKAPEGTVAANVLDHGVGALNVASTKLASGRWPTNAFLDEAQAELLSHDEGLAARYFFVAKPDRAERVTVDGVAHPTVKPLALMRELVKLVTAPGAIVLDPFAGSGTTVEAALIEGRVSIGIERDPAYLSLIRARVDRRLGRPAPRAATPEPATGGISSPDPATTDAPWALFDLKRSTGEL